MKKQFLLALVLALILLCGVAFAYESLDRFNKYNWAKYFDQLVGFPYDSHGCLHFAPNDAYLLYKTVPAGIPLTIKNYNLGRNDPPFDLEKVPYLIDQTADLKALEKHAAVFKNYPTELVVYPSLDRLVIMVNGGAYAQVNALSGLPEYFLLAWEVELNRPIKWDSMLSTPTDPGRYTVLRTTDHYLSSTYYRNTIVPFGAWLRKEAGGWFYQKEGRWFKAPDHVAADLALPPERQQYRYYDQTYDQLGKLTAARYAGHDFGKYVLLWTKDGKNHYPEMGYAAGELVYEQLNLVKEVVGFLTNPGGDDFEELVGLSPNFSFYQKIFEFRDSQGSKTSADLNPVGLAYYRLFNNWQLSARDKELIDPRLLKAFREVNENRLPRDQEARRRALGLYQYLRLNALAIDKQADWYHNLKKDWPIFKAWRQELRRDFDQMGVYSLENRQNLTEKWFQDRLEFKKVVPPSGARYVQDLSFKDFFRPSVELTVFNEREKALMVERVRRAVKEGEVGLNLKIVPALNEYNFGILLNEILGDLYKSHGCLHASPRNMLFLYELLPLNSRVIIHPYTAKLSEETSRQVPYLAELVNFREDLERLRQEFSLTAEVRVEVYPETGYWLLYRKEEPVAKLQVRGGPRSRMYMVQGRDKQGRPIFEPNLAYPTTPGNFFVWRKVTDYVSNIYRETTLVPQGGLIRKSDKGWIFQDAKGNWRPLTKMIAEDLKHPPEERAYNYYDVLKDASGEVVEMKWGSHPFGRYAIITSVDRKTMHPELIHSSGDLIIEERSLVDDLIKIMTAPADELDDCLAESPHFELYRACYEFVQNPLGTQRLETIDQANYKLYYGLKLNTTEAAVLPVDVVIADKILRGKPLTAAERGTMVSLGIARDRGGKFTPNMEKILGLQFDAYQYVVTIEKFAHHYEVLKKHWPQLVGLRRALLADFNDFAVRNPQLFHNFMRELMLKRNNLERLSQAEALAILYQMLGE